MLREWEGCNFRKGPGKGFLRRWHLSNGNTASLSWAFSEDLIRKYTDS